MCKFNFCIRHSALVQISDILGISEAYGCTYTYFSCLIYVQHTVRGYIVFVMLSVHLFVVCSSHCTSTFTSKFCVKLLLASGGGTGGRYM